MGVFWFQFLIGSRDIGWPPELWGEKAPKTAIGVNLLGTIYRSFEQDWYAMTQWYILG